jgi:hypothetical protein
VWALQEANVELGAVNVDLSCPQAVEQLFAAFMEKDDCELVMKHRRSLEGDADLAPQPRPRKKSSIRKRSTRRRPAARARAASH